MDEGEGLGAADGGAVGDQRRRTGGDVTAVGVRAQGCVAAAGVEEVELLPLADGGAVGDEGRRARVVGGDVVVVDPRAKSSGGVTLNPASGNTATLTFTAASARYVRLNVTANTGWPAAQLAEFQVFSS
ncbi:hypothetical protein [Streptomyces sp. NBC_01190]|uniref:hypothetical protein n=1 Tax=Streptomyces sp. NBC_01190 TaxID=2903767 RepID=UPI0038699B11|nr:hypothetical protein OG519_13830 [Streptomyces sp. NBC_01190]